MPLIRKDPEQKPPPSVVAVEVRAGLRSGSADARWQAAREAGTDPQIVPDLAAALAREQDWRAREAIFTALVRIGTRESVQAIVPGLRSEDANVRTGAMDALRAMPAATSRELQQLLNDPDDDVRLLACDLARVVSGSAAAKLLCDLIDSEKQANVCAAAVEVLAEVGNADSVDALLRCAGRFPGDPFLVFAVEAATERLTAGVRRG